MALYERTMIPVTAEFTGVLAQRLKPGEDPSSKLPALYEALGVDTGDSRPRSAFCCRFQAREPPTPAGRSPNLLLLISDATGSYLNELPLPGSRRSGPRGKTVQENGGNASCGNEVI